jgi:hypothetical protein
VDDLFEKYKEEDELKKEAKKVELLVQAPPAPQPKKITKPVKLSTKTMEEMG